MRISLGLRALSRIFDDSGADTPARVIGICTFLVGLNALTWIGACAVFATRPLLMGTALLAYTFGLRHAVDADHICAIDNVTRRLMQEKKRPVALGFFFSLGHSTIVFALSLAIAVAAAGVKHAIPNLQSVGGVAGPALSAAFLFAIGVVNVIVLWDILKSLAAAKRGEIVSDEALENSLADRGLLSRLFRPMLAAVDASWKMYPIGVLFGLGFDTATEVGLLGIAAIEAAKGMPLWAIFIFPTLFTAAMSLVDTTDGILMLGAYGWAFVKPMRKLYYNMHITLLSALTALVVGGIELASIAGPRSADAGTMWGYVDGLNDNFGTVGLTIVAILLVSWGVCALVYRVRGRDGLDAIKQ